MTVLQVASLSDELTSALRERFDARVLPPDDRDAYLRTHGADVTVAVTGGSTGVDADLLAALPRLGAIVNLGAGYESIDVAAAARRGIPVSNTPDVLSDAVADLTVGLIIDVFRRISASDRYVRAGNWATNGSYPLARQVTGSRVGILGLGRIGHAIADRLSAFRCPVSYHNRRELDDVPYAYAQSARALAAGSDVLVIAIGGGPGTHHLVDREVLEALGPDGVLINVGRGSVVDEKALVEALDAHRIHGAGLDVYEDEPHVPAALLDRDDVVLVPHIGSATTQTRRAMADLVLENVEAFLTTGKLVTPVPA